MSISYCFSEGVNPVLIVFWLFDRNIVRNERSSCLFRFRAYIDVVHNGRWLWDSQTIFFEPLNMQADSLTDFSLDGLNRIAGCDAAR